LLILVDGDLDHSISVANHFADTDSRLSYIKTSANEFLDFNQIDSLLSPLPEPPGPIFGTDGDDTLIGTNKNDVIIGGKGNDFLSGLGGHDFYEFSLGDGQDIIYNDSLNPDQEEDILAIVGGSKFDVWLSRQDQSLVLDFLGGDDKITIKDWYASDSHKLDSVMMGSEVLYSQQVDMLVEAMSGFGVPASGSIELTPDQRDRMDMVIANSWQRLGGGGGTDVPK
ncbi:calcium-binding protein, partial [Pseudomonas gingeri]